ncbi:MAG TPA: VOC family protein [Solirubrobacteraceae bacterium]
MEAIDHLDLVVSSLEDSLAFYRELLAPLGYARESEIEGERGERVVYLGREGGRGSLSLRARQSDAHAVPNRRGFRTTRSEARGPRSERLTPRPRRVRRDDAESRA